MKTSPIEDVTFEDVTFEDVAPKSGRSPFSLFRDKRGISTSLQESVGSIALGVALLALVGVGIGAAITFSNDAGAKSSLESVKSAQVLHQAKTGSFGSLDELSGGDSPALTTKPDNVAIALSSDKRNYCAFVESKSMFHTPHWVTGRDAKILNAKPTDTTAGVTCPTAVPAPPAG